MQAKRLLSRLPAIIFTIVFLTAAGCSAALQSSAKQTAGVKQVDALTFLLAFQQGKAGQYEGYLVKGEGREFGISLMTGTIPGEKPLALTIGTIGSNGEPGILETMDQWVAAESAGQAMLMVELHGETIIRKDFEPWENPPVCSFFGTYAGESVMLLRQVSKAGVAHEDISAPVLTGCEMK
jgi:hypothetical protein